MVSWNCAFLLPGNKIKFGRISEERGQELVEYIKSEQEYRQKEGLPVPITIHNTLDNIPFVVLDVLVLQVEEESIEGYEY